MQAVIAAPSPAAECGDMRSRGSRSTVSGSGDASRSDTSSYPGGKSGAGIYQRLINLIPPRRVLIVPFAGRCGITLAPRGSAAEPGGMAGRAASNSVAPVGCRPGCAAESVGAAGESVTGRGRMIQRRSTVADERDSAVTPIGATMATDAGWCDSRGSRMIQRRQLKVSQPTGATLVNAAEAFVLCDPPYVISERSTGRIYAHELTDADHLRLLEVLTRLPAAEHSVLLCGYESPLYASLEPWRQIRHRVPTRGGLQDETIWLNYPEPELLHDHRYVGRTRRERERIRRRQKTVTTMLAAMDPRERAAMLEAIVDAAGVTSPANATVKTALGTARTSLGSKASTHTASPQACNPGESHALS